MKSRDVVANVLKDINLKDKLTDDDMTKLGFCILTEMLSTHQLLDRLPAGEEEQKRHMLADHMITFLGFNWEKMRTFGYTEFAKYGYGSNKEDDNNWDDWNKKGE